MDFSALDARMQWYTDQQILGCIETLILDGTDIVHEARHGVFSAVDDRPLPADTIFRIYSSTKIVTSVALMMLWEEGRFRLDDELAQYLGQFSDMRVLKPDAASIEDVEPANSPILIRHVLSHSGGFSYGVLDPTSVIDQAYMRAGAAGLASRPANLAALCDALADLPLAYQPGSSWRYSFSTDICARLVEVLSGQRFDAFLRERLFEPLGMVDTDFWVPADKRHRLAAIYTPADPMDPMKPGLIPADEALTEAFAAPPEFLDGGAGLVSTMADYTTFIRMIVNDGEWDGRRYLNADTLALMRTNQLADGVKVQLAMWPMPATEFGLGFALRSGPTGDEPDSVTGEYHWGGVAGTHSFMSPRTGLTGLCFTQRMPGFWHPFSHDFRRLLYEQAVADGR